MPDKNTPTPIAIEEILITTLEAANVPNASAIAKQVAENLPALYDEIGLRQAFKAGWDERNKSPGLKKVARKSLGNAVLGSIGGGRYAETDLKPDTKTYHASIWSNSRFKKSLSDR